MTKRTVDLNAPFGYGKKHAETITAQVPLKYLRGVAKSPNKEAAQYAKDVLVALAPEKPAPTKPLPSPEPKPAPTAPAGKLEGPGAGPVAPLVRGIYTLVYSSRLVYVGGDKKRLILQRGDTMEIGNPEYARLGSLMRKFVPGELSADRIAALLKSAKGGVPRAKGPRNPVETIDYKTGMPVRDATPGHPVSTVNLPNYVPMTVDELKDWAAKTPWVATDLSDLDRKPDVVAALKSEADRVNQTEAEPDGGPAGEMEDV